MGKHRFLFRLMVIVLIGVLLPAVLLFSFFWSRSFDKMNSANDAFYENLVMNFANSFYDKVQNTESHLSSLVVSSKDPKSIFYNGGELLKRSYWRFCLINSAEYSQSGYETARFGIYYYELDTVFFRRATMSASQYMTVYADSAHCNRLEPYFQPENFKDNKVFYLPIGSDQQDTLLIGYNKTLGRNNDKVLVFYLLSKDEFVQEAKYINGYEDVRFYILDESGEKILLELGRDNPGTIENWQDVLDSQHEGIYRLESDLVPMTFALSVESDSLKGSITDFYHGMRNILVVSAIVLVCVCFGAIYIVYNPIYHLVLGLEWNTNGEIETIRQALDSSADTLLERDVTILNLLLNHLIYGVPIDIEKIRFLGLDKELKYYFVSIVDGVILLNREIQQLSEELEKGYSARILMKESEEKNESVLFLFMKNDNAKDILHHIEVWLKTNDKENVTLYSGNVVGKLNDIQTSFLSCIKSRDGVSAGIKKVQNEVGGLKKLNERQRNMTEEIMNYIDLHFREPSFCQMMVADAFQMSNYTLSRIFSSQVGVGFSEYINSKRLEYAQELLRTTSHSIKEISGMSGFSSDTYFYRLFKLTFDMSPSTYRNEFSSEGI